MGSGIYVKGQKYISSKDACTISGYTSEQIEKLCSQGELRSKRFGGGCFVEERSLSEYLKELSHFNDDKESSRQEKIENNKYSVWRGFSMAVLGVLVIALSVICGGYFRGDVRNLKISIADMPSSYNSTRFIRGDNGMMAAVGKVNNTVADGVEITSHTIASHTIYNGMAMIFAGAHDFILKMYDLTVHEEKGMELKLPKEDIGGVKASQAAILSGIEGIVIAPSKNKYDNADTIEQIKNSFSDEVKIIPDEGGGSGIIQPIFRDSDGDEYIYILVPVQEDKK